MSDSIAALRDAIRHCNHSQTELARRIGVKRSTVNNWLNGYARISYFYAVKIELVLNGAVKREHLAPHARFSRNTRATDWEKLRTEKLEESCFFSTQFPISVRVKKAIAFKSELGNRQGQRSDLALRQNFGEVHGRSDAWLSQKFGLGNKETFRQAWQVVRLGCQELIAVMDRDEVAVSTAAHIATLSLDEQRHTVSLGKKAMIAMAKTLRLCQRQQRCSQSLGLRTI